MKAGLEEPEYRNFSAKELSGTTVVDSFTSPIYYDNVFSTQDGYDDWGGDSGSGADPRGGTAKNPDFDLWSLGNDADDHGDNIHNWRT